MQPERNACAASALESSSAFDHFLSGKEQYKLKDWAAVLSQFDEVLRIRPDHFWCTVSAVAPCSLGGDPGQGRAECLFAERAGLCVALRAAGLRLLSGRGGRSPRGQGFEGEGGFAKSQGPVAAQRSRGRLQHGPRVAVGAAEHGIARRAPGEPGTAVARGREWSKAIADLDRAILLKPAQWQAHEMLAQVYDRQDKPDLAVEQFTQAIAVQPVMVSLYRAGLQSSSGREQIASGRERATATSRWPSG